MNNEIRQVPEKRAYRRSLKQGITVEESVVERPYCAHQSAAVAYFKTYMIGLGMRYGIISLGTKEK